VGAVLFSLPAALIGAAYYTVALNLSLLEGFSLYVGLGFAVMAAITVLNGIVFGISRVQSQLVTRSR
jgi:hypothetical protein